MSLVEVLPEVRSLSRLDKMRLIVVVLSALVGSFPSVRLAFAWAQTDAVSVILGQVNFFLEFDVCFFRSQGAFEVRPKP